MFRIKANDFKDAYIKLNQYLFMNEAHDYVRSNVTAHSFHNSIEIASAECDLNIHDINYTFSKWRQLLRLYFDPIQLGVMCARLLHYKEDWKHKYIPDIGMNFKERRNMSGSCLMSMTIGYNNGSWHAEIFTRASELTMRWYVDLIFVHVLIREIGKILGFTPQECRVYWRMACSYQSITSMPWFLVMTGQEQWLKDAMNQSPEELEKLGKWKQATIRRYKKTYLGGDYENYKVQQRPAEAYKMFIGEMERKCTVFTKDLQIPPIDTNHKLEMDEDEKWQADLDGLDINELVKQAVDEDMFGKGGYR